MRSRAPSSICWSASLQTCLDVMAPARRVRIWGSIVALVDASSAASFSTAIADRYRAESGLEPRVIVSSPSEGARLL